MKLHFALTGLLSVLLLLAGCGESPSTGTALEPTINPRVDALLERMMTEEHFSGAVLVTVGDEIVHAKGYGPASDTQANAADTLFHVASITKQFTAAAVMQQVEADRIDLDESINRYLPEHYRSPRWDVVTVHHLLTHTSGVPDYGVTRDYYDVVDGFCLGDTVDGMIREAMSKDPQFEPGSRFSYSNIGFTLLGLAIEEISGMPYATYVEERILEPMGMHDSRLHVEGHVPFEREAEGLRWSDEEGRHIKDDIVSLPVTAPDGGLVTSLTDFRAWAGIYLGKPQTILSQSSLAQITARHTLSDGEDGPFTSYGYGLATGERMIGHSGYIVGFRSQFIVDRQSETLIAVFTNNTSNDPQRIAVELLGLLMAKEG